MPTYESKCPECGHEETYFKSMADCYDTPMCAVCNTKTEKVILTAPLGVVDNPAFMSQYKHMY